MTRYEWATDSERKVAAELKRSGIPAKWIGGQSRFDILAGRSVRVEVKASSIRGSRISPYWTFTIKRDLILDEREVDFYVLRLGGAPKALRYLVLRAPLKKDTVCVPLRDLIKKFGRSINAFHRIAKAVERERSIRPKR